MSLNMLTGVHHFVVGLDVYSAGDSGHWVFWIGVGESRVSKRP